MSDIRVAERGRRQHVFHVVRGDRYACGAKRAAEDPWRDTVPAVSVPAKVQCLRVGCQNDYAKAEAERRKAGPIGGGRFA